MKFFGFMKFLMSVLFFGIIMYGGYFIFNQYVWKAINPQATAEQKMTKEVGKISNINQYSNQTSNFDSSKPFSMLLLGVDGGGFKNNRTDTMILAIVDPVKDKISLMSIPRDLRVQIPGHNGHEKINAAFAYGGIDLAEKTVENVFGIPVKNYAIINFDGFQEVVNAMGGINLNVEKTMTFSDRITHTMFTLHKGQQKLNGIEALNYARFRHDGEGDYGRQRRQQQVIKAIADQSMSLRSIPKIVGVIQAVNKNFESNISYQDLGLLALKMRSLQGNDINTVKFDSKPEYMNGVAYVTATDTDIANASNKLQNLLQNNE